MWVGSCGYLPCEVEHPLKPAALLTVPNPNPAQRETDRDSAHLAILAFALQQNSNLSSIWFATKESAASVG